MAPPRNGLIDGWRGLSVLLVILGHSVAFRYATDAPLAPIHELIHARQWVELIRSVGFRIVAPLGEIGVQFFFVISGYLITSLLSAEENRNGQISLVAFYIRRIFRIMPAFYLYFLIVWLLRACGLLQLNNDAFARSGLYLCNVSGFKCSWWLAHTWSLSVEEQFYIVWPIAFIFLSRLRLRGTFFILSSLLAGSLFLHDLVSFACIGSGAFLAISARARDWIYRYSSNYTVGAAMAYLLAYPIVPFVPRGLVVLTPLLTTFVFYASINSVGPLRAVTTSTLLQRIGLVSYSLYLWQQLGTAPIVWNDTQTGASNLYGNYQMLSWLFIIPAMASFVLIERPSQRIGQQISRWLMRRETVSPTSQTEQCGWPA